MFTTKCKQNPGWTIHKYISRLCVRVDLQNKVPSKRLNTHKYIVSWLTVRTVFILAFILGLNIYSIDFSNEFPQEDITKGNILLVSDIVESDQDQPDSILNS